MTTVTAGVLGYASLGGFASGRAAEAAPVVALPPELGMQAVAARADVSELVDRRRDGARASLAVVQAADAAKATAAQAAAAQAAAAQAAADQAAKAAADQAAAAKAAADQAAKAAADQAAAAAAAARQAEADRAAREAQRQAVANSDPRSIARVMLAEYGWSSSQFSCLDSLWTKESGWNPSATNRSSGAYGIPQSLPASKMASAGSDWRTNPATQIRWGLTYIKGSYGTPCSAWAHSQAVNWY